MSIRVRFPEEQVTAAAIKNHINKMITSLTKRFAPKFRSPLSQLSRARVCWS